MAQAAPAATDRQNGGTGGEAPPGVGLWIERLAVTNFRNYRAAELQAGPCPVVLTGANGAGKTNLIEAISLLVPGNGLRRASLDELARAAGDGAWAVAAHVHGTHGAIEIGTGRRPIASAAQDGHRRTGRIVRIDGETVGATQLAAHIEIVWLTPAMDGLFSGPAADRRAFLDRLVLCIDPAHAARAARFERAMRQRNRLLTDPPYDRVLLDALEMQMAEHGVAIAAARQQAMTALTTLCEARQNVAPASPFPWFGLELVGTLEAELRIRPALDVEDGYRERLRHQRDRDGAAGRTLQGPHRTDLHLTHGPKAMPARLCSTGEQKALLTGLVLSHARLLSERRQNAAPILLLDEIAAHFDPERRAALFEEILALKAQAWMTGTDLEAFAPLGVRAVYVRIDDGQISAA